MIDLPHRPLPALVLLLALASGLLAGCGKSYEGPHRHVVLLSMDTTRADHLGCYGNALVRTPFLDRLAAEGVRFAQVTSPAPTTLAAHTSIMTGTYPHTHGVVRNGFRVHPDNRMLAEVLREEGFRTAAFLGSFALESRFGFDQGFDYFDETFDLELDARTYEQNQRGAEVVTDAVLAYLDRSEVDLDERQFLFVHYFDPHTPYNPPEPWNRMYLREDGRDASNLVDVSAAVGAHARAAGVERTMRTEGGLSVELLEKARCEPLGTLDRDLAALYAGEVSFMDAEIGRLLDGLAERGVLEEAIVVVVADHGETFWEHADTWNHGLAVYDTTVRVPWILRLPEGAGAGSVVDTPASTLDVLPTLLEVLALPAPAAVEGTSLAAALRGEELARGPVFCEATQPFRDWRPGGDWPNRPNPRCVRAGPLKYVLSPYLGDLEELYDLASDPDERTNLLRSDPEGHAAERARLRALLDAWCDAADPLPSEFETAQQKDTLRRLRQLGYVGRVGEPLPARPAAGPARPRELR